MNTKQNSIRDSINISDRALGVVLQMQNATIGVLLKLTSFLV